LRSLLEQTNAKIASLVEEERLLGYVSDLFRELIDAEIKSGVQITENLLSDGLSAVFYDQMLSVKAEVGVQRGKITVDLITSQMQENGQITEGIATEGFGGSVATVQSTLLRLIVAMRRKLRLVLFLDESLGALDEQYVERMGNFLRDLCEKLGVDILLITHNPPLVHAAHKAYRIKPHKDGAKFELIGGKNAK
tara:strand:- start:61 stop:642 length:582 start_codon:yes stop_codon:yes gene_type:complete